ncbi:wound-responsive family protein [Zea mays]|uniref:Wound-responsive family protein n=1 Tax=Zea mays TaxID=4577 RepID=A0A1D6N5G1_MAIZE|nr:wound-responsive family protein [Zea mays]
MEQMNILASLWLLRSILHKQCTQLLVGRVQELNPKAPGLSELFAISRRSLQNANNGKIQEHELMNRLMGIVGHLVQRRTLKLAELWPHGCMDNVGIKDAIYRSKERRRLLYSQQKVRSEERMKRKRLAATAKLPDGLAVAMQSGVAPQVAQPPITNPITYHTADYGQNPGLKYFDRARETSSSAIPDDGNRIAGEVKKKKRKPEYDPVDTQANLPRAPMPHGSEKQKPSKPADEASAGSLPSMATTQTVLGLPSVLGHNQQPS